MIRAIAIDDEPMPLNILTRYCSTFTGISLLETFNSVKAAREWLSKHKVDLIFLDINMPSQSGLDFIRSIEGEYHVIFTTAHPEYALESYELQAIDYLLKPFSLERFLQAIEKAVVFHQFGKDQNAYDIFIKVDATTIKIPISDITYIEANADYLKVHRKYHKMALTRMTMGNISRLLPDSFIRIHRSFLVPIHEIDQWSNKAVFVAGREIPIGKTYVNEVIGCLKRLKQSSFLKHD
ncbi:LytR/AlgR family response regulator transcription factor [Arthrospiribacter ruber]|uniref:DNA-binding response regulator n=1 Tax=Arthrospiribacter ruber TaxID=2487934 RepID=A0A951J0B4_9BACT|nr:LytTR family DNA-binding domain-containing protein [Arthrospiribacter ruber]MBW3470465.1 DNA-binding response regulator [Arthrospiribacter ruber]